MKKLVLSALVILIVQFSFAQNDTDNKALIEPEIFTIVENMPSWKGCEKIKNQTSKLECNQSKINEYFARSIIYPVNSIKNKISGTVYVTFIISKEGKVLKPQILRGVAEDLDEEAIRVVSAMPEWIPGSQNGNLVNIQYNIPVKFSIK